MSRPTSVMLQVIFIDELDAIAPSRGGVDGSKSSGGGASARVLTTLLTEMDALGTAAVVVLAATNRPDSLDAALRRPGRFDREVEVGVPTPSERREILVKQLGGVRHSLSDAQVGHALCNVRARGRWGSTSDENHRVFCSPLLKFLCRLLNWRAQLTALLQPTWRPW